MVSAIEKAKRALVAIILHLAGIYGCRINVTRDATEAEVARAYRTLSRRVHPDRGGLDDLCKKRMPLGKTAYKQRIRAIMRSAQAQKVASNIFASFRKTCQKCIENDGHHTGK